LQAPNRHKAAAKRLLQQLVLFVAAGRRPKTVETKVKTTAYTNNSKRRLKNTGAPRRIRCGVFSRPI
jgi:hypothetical protein